MKASTSDLMTRDEAERLAAERVADALGFVKGRYHVKVTRADGSIEEKYVDNIVLRTGLNRLANRGVQASGTSVFYIVGVGTATATHSLDSAQGGFGEVSRKTSNVTGSSAQSREWIFLTQTWAGFADSITSVALDTVFTSDYPNSHASTGAYLNAANGLGVTLGNSDFLALTAQIRVGSHNLSHST